MGKVQDSTAEAILAFYVHVRQKYDEELRPYTKQHLKNELSDIMHLLKSMDTKSEEKGIILREWMKHELSQLQIVFDKNEDLDRPFRLFVIGTGKVGKSTFINSLVGEKVAEVDYLPKTWRIDIFTHDEGQSIEVGFANGYHEKMTEDRIRPLLENIDKRAEANISQITRRIKEVKKDKNLTKEEQKEQEEMIIESYERDDDVTHVIWPISNAPFLNDFDLVDTPGMNQILYNHKIKREALAYYREADGILWLLPADNLSDKCTYEDVQSMNEIYPQKSADAIAVLNHFDYVPEKEVDDVCREANRLYGNYFREIFPYSAKIVYDRITEGKTSEEAEKLKYEIHQAFYRKAQESKIKDLDNLLKEEQKKTTFFLRRKARHLREKYNSCNQIEKDWKNQLEVEKDRFLDNIHVYLSAEIEQVYKRARDNEKILENMDETTREEYIRNDILKYNKLKNKIQSLQGNFTTYLYNSAKDFCQNYVYIMKGEKALDIEQVDFSVICQFNKAKVFSALSRLVEPFDLKTGFSSKMTDAINHIFSGDLSNASKAFHPSEHIRAIYEMRFEELENNLHKELHKLLLKTQYKAFSCVETYFEEMYCNKYEFNDLVKKLDEIQSRINNLYLQMPTVVQVIKGEDVNGFKNTN